MSEVLVPMDVRDLAKEKSLMLRAVTKEMFGELASSQAFPFDNPNHTLLVKPLMQSDIDPQFKCAIDVTNSILYWYREEALDEDGV